MTKRRISLYLHIPFCAKKCLYCDFLSFPAESKVQESYVRALAGELAGEAEKYGEYVVDSLFFGGGTPSILSPESIAFLLETVKKHYCLLPDAEITMEANPGTVNGDKLGIYRESGVNRLSLGLQSAEKEELLRLGRIHSYEIFLDGFAAVREAGFYNVNVDIMSALPGQTLLSCRRTLERVAALRPEHISAYSLIIEEGTYFWQHRQELELPGEDDEREMYEMAAVILGDKGYHRYEISNYALEGRECRHNTGYWERHEYAGFGIGAASLVDNVRWKNCGDIVLYCAGKAGREEVHALSRQEQMEEFMFLGLRLMKGVSATRFAECFGVAVESIYGDPLRNMMEKGLLEETGRGEIRLTGRGIDLSNVVMAEFLF